MFSGGKVWYFIILCFRSAEIIRLTMPIFVWAFFNFMNKIYNCSTKYPIMMIHGMGFRDGKIGYWGRIPEILRKNGADVHFGFQDANGAIETNCQTLKASLEKILAETGAEKVNIIAHSKGGVEARYLISTMGMGGKIASVTTISTCHNGSRTMDKLMKIPRPLLKMGSKIFDFFQRIGGDKNPDTYRCLEQLTTAFMDGFNAENPDKQGIFYQSYGFGMKNACSDIFMSFPYFMVKLLNDKSDGLLTADEVKWTNFHGVFTGTGNRGISHCDEVDFRRRPLSRKQPKNQYEISDITEFYAEIVADLKSRGL